MYNVSLGTLHISITKPLVTLELKQFDFGTIADTQRQNLFSQQVHAQPSLISGEMQIKPQ